MAINKQITLTEKAVNAGPNFDVYYTLNGTTFSFVSTVYLPALGASAIVSVPDTTLYIKLQSKGICTNEVVNPVPNAILGDFGIDYDPLDFN